MRPYLAGVTLSVMTLGLALAACGPDAPAQPGSTRPSQTGVATPVASHRQLA